MLLAVLLILAFFLIVNLMIAIIIGVLSLSVLRLGVLGLVDALTGVEINGVVLWLWVVEMS